jgi:hypothetical protein
VGRAKARAYPQPGGARKAKPFEFRNADAPEVLDLLERDEAKQAERDRAWVASIERAIGAESAAQLVAAIRELDPSDAHTLLRGASLEPVDGAGFLPKVSRQRAALRALPAGKASTRSLPSDAAAVAVDEDGGEDERDFWQALEAFRDGTTTAIEVDRVLSRPALRRRVDLRADFDRTLRVKGIADE